MHMVWYGVIHTVLCVKQTQQFLLNNKLVIERRLEPKVKDIIILVK